MCVCASDGRRGVVLELVAPFDLDSVNDDLFAPFCCLVGASLLLLPPASCGVTRMRELHITHGAVVIRSAPRSVSNSVPRAQQQHGPLALALAVLPALFFLRAAIGARGAECVVRAFTVRPLSQRTC